MLRKILYPQYYHSISPYLQHDIFLCDFSFPSRYVLFWKAKWSLVGFPVNLRSGDFAVSTLKVIATTLMDVVINFYYAADAKAHMINQLVSGYFS